MSKQVFVKQYRNLLEISRDGREPLSDREYDLLVPHMEYVQLVTLHGRDAYADGEYRPIQSLKKRLYWWDDQGRLVCGKGYVDRVGSIFQGLGYEIRYQDRSPERPRPRAFETRWANLVDEHFRPLQEDCVKAVEARVAAGRGGIVKAIPGFGKSHILRHLCLLYPKAKIAISLPDIDNTNKTFRHLAEALPNVGQVGGGMNAPRRVTLYTQGSIHHIPDDIDLLFVDECHKYASEKTSEHLGRIMRNALSFGFSATPEGRLDRQDAKLEPMFGPIIFEVSWAQGISHGLVVPITTIWHDVFIKDNPCQHANHLGQLVGYRGLPKKRHGLWRNDARNKVVAAVANAHPPDEQVLVLCQFVEHAMFLKKHMPDFELVYANSDQDRLDDIADIKGLKKALRRQGFEPEAMTRDRRENMRIAFERGRLKKVICNDVWSTGVSFNQLQVLVRADARANDILDEQIPGRVSRIHPESGKSTGYLHDFLDQFDRGMQDAAQERRRNYRSKGWNEVMPARVGALDHRLKGRPAKGGPP